MSKGVRYRVLRKLAHGGMAEIFLALQVGAEGFEKPVVLKRVLPQLAKDRAFVRMFVDEAHIVSSLNHSNLVQVLDLGQAGDEFFLVLEFVDGWSLDQVRRRATKARMKLPLPLALYIVSSLCRALDYVHRRTRNGVPLGIVHRDVTPQNVLISSEGEVKLADFGIAKAVGKREKSTTGVIKGKFAYMSPEQAIGAELDARSDLFSVGTLLYLLTTGQKPFDAPTDLETLMQVRRARFEKPSDLVRDFDPEVERFLVRALRAERSKRFQSAMQMAERLDKILAKLGQPSGPSALKRWLDALSARDGVRPPGELHEASPEQAAATMVLGTSELELEDVAPRSAETDDDADDELLSSDISNAKTELAHASDLSQLTRPARAMARERDATTAVAPPGYPDVDAPADAQAEHRAITIVVPRGTIVAGLDPSDDAVKVRYEGGEREANESAARDAEPTRLFTASHADEPRIPDAEPTVRLDPTPPPPAVPPQPVSAASVSDDVVLVLAEEKKPAAAPPQRARRSPWRIAITTLLSLTVLAAASIFARPYLPTEHVSPQLRSWLDHCAARFQDLPRAVRAAATRLVTEDAEVPAGSR